jgi:hypothetical protein
MCQEILQFLAGNFAINKDENRKSSFMKVEALAKIYYTSSWNDPNTTHTLLPPQAIQPEMSMPVRRFEFEI